MQDAKFIIALDYDSTIAVDDFPKNEGRLLPGAVNAIRAIDQMGGYIIIFSGRGGESRQYAIAATGEDPLPSMVETLERNGIPYDQVWTDGGKPLFDFIVDDRSIPPFMGDWQAVVQHIQQKLSDPKWSSVLDEFEPD